MILLNSVVLIICGFFWIFFIEDMLSVDELYFFQFLHLSFRFLALLRSRKLPDNAALKWCWQKSLSGSQSLGELVPFPHWVWCLLWDPSYETPYFLLDIFYQIKKFPFDSWFYDLKIIMTVLYFIKCFFSCIYWWLYVFSLLFCVVNNTVFF